MIYKMADGANMPTAAQKPDILPMTAFFLLKIACPPFRAGHNPALEKQGLCLCFHSLF
jgi:hypothetical protein